MSRSGPAGFLTRHAQWKRSLPEATATRKENAQPASCAWINRFAAPVFAPQANKLAQEPRRRSLTLARRYAGGSPPSSAETHV